MSVTVLEGPTHLPRAADSAAHSPADRESVSSASMEAAIPASPPLPVELAQALDTTVAVLVLLGIWIAVGLGGALPESMEAFLARPVPLKHAVLVGGFMILWPRLLHLFRLYEDDPTQAGVVMVRTVAACAVGAVLAYHFPLAGVVRDARPWAAVLFFTGATAGTLAVRTPLWRLAAATARTRPRRRVVVVGSGPRAVKVARELTASPDTHQLLGYVDSVDHPLAADLDAPKLADLEQLEDLLFHEVVDEVLIALPIKSCYEEIQHVIRVCERTGTESRYLADLFRASVARPRYDRTHRYPVVAMKVFYDDYRLSIKRLIDIVVSLTVLLVLSPLLIGIAIAVKATSEGPVIFAQERYGRGKRRFKMYKFRTMVPNAEALQVELESQNEAVGPVFKIKDDPRVTPVGRWLRRTSLDELPQLVNVLLGQMSLVGPRPMAVRDVKLFDQAWFMRRFSAPPGLTGLWQVSGRSNLGFDDWVTLDLKYIDEWSLVQDLRILLRTVPVVLRGVGAM